MLARAERSGDVWPTGLPAVPTGLFPAGVVLFGQDERVCDVYAIEAGCVKLLRTGASDREVIVALRHRGWIVGGAAATLGLSHPVTAETLTSCTLRRMDASAFRRAFESDKGVGAWVLRMHAREVYEQTRRIEAVQQLPARRLIGLLGDLLRATPVVRRSDGWAFEPPLTRAEMGQMVSLTPEHVSRVLGQLEARGVLVRHQGWILVPDASPLASDVPARHERQRVPWGEQALT